ncbi:hypothetical protein AB0D57_34475 [Streptomyces sp. NPDC048275]|uniref:hypothetical protein n=1 Tax=Streptomyces sp. NPDC048275 TaxID=3155629 RepID=UPI0033EDCE31
MAHLRLLMGCWRSAVVLCGPLVGTQLIIALWQDGFSWASLGEDVGSSLLAWGVVSLVWAALGWLSLRRRARGAGLEFSAQVLKERQTHLLRPAAVADGWLERVRSELTASERVFLVAEKGQEEIRFRWRPGRSESSVWGSLVFDAGSGTVLLDLRDGEGNWGVAGLRRGASFVAVCQIARVGGLVGAVSTPGELENSRG